MSSLHQRALTSAWPEPLCERTFFEKYAIDAEERPEDSALVSSRLHFLDHSKIKQRVRQLNKLSPRKSQEQP